VEEDGLPAELEVTAFTSDGLIMALSHRTQPTYGVQFHPESILTPDGKKILRNFVQGHDQ
jgi:anthranilate synthase component 2